MFQRFIARFGVVIFLLLAGVYLLLNNLGVIGPWGDLIWGALFAAVGLGFLIWFFADRERWWRVIPGFTLLAAGAVIMLESQKIALGNWAGAIVLFGVALGFWALLLRGSEFWWAVLPAGVLTVTSALVGLRAQLSGQMWTAILLLGLGLVFVLLYLLRFGQKDTHWAIVPAGWLIVLGLVTLVSALELPATFAKWWPILLILLALAYLVLMLVLRRSSSAPAASNVPAKDYDAPVSAKGTSATQTLPPAPEPAPKPAPATPSAGPEVDIYKLIEQQPKEPPPPSGGDVKPQA
jgi:hypothetical protein